MNTYRFGLRPFFPTSFNDFFEQTPSKESIFKPATNISEDEKQYLIEISLAGFKKDEINIEYDSYELKVSAEREQSETIEKKYSWNEFAYKTKFERTFQLSENIEVSDIKADFQDGILSVSIPKKEIKELSAKKIEIN